MLWRRCGKGCTLDQRLAHGGQSSLRLRISPEQLKEQSGISVGASTTINKFDQPQRLRMAAWCRTENVSGEKDRDFLIYALLNYADGTRETLRLPLPGGTHDWQLVEGFFHPVKELNPDQSPMLYITMSSKTGIAWLDDIYLGPAQN